MNKLGQYLSKYYKTVLQLSAIFIISCAVGDDSPPAQIEDFTISSNNKIFKWTAPGDDGTSGKATLYLLRFFTEEQVAELLGTGSLDGLPESQVHEAVRNNFGSATHLPRFLVPKNAGESELTAIPRLEISGTKKYFYSIVANDETGTGSSPSNVLEVTSGLVSANFIGKNQGCLGSSASSGEFIHEAGEENLGDITRDIIIGDPCLGKVYIFIGGGNITGDMENIDVASADVTITGNPQDEFGHSVSAVGNVSGSSLYEEFAIGAPGALNDTGQVFILEGNRNLPSTIDLRTNAAETARFIITGESSGDRFGFKIARRGSNNFFVSAPSALSETGKVYRFIGSNLQDQDNAEAEGIITGREQGEQFGYSIIDGGNINSSSPNEFIVGAPGGGRAYIFFNTGTFNLANLPEESTGDVMTISGRPEDRFGEAVGGGFDFDGIGQNSDVVISAPSADNNKGSVFVYTDDVVNEAAADNSREIAFTEFTLKVDGENEGDKLGAGLAVVPDINPTLGIDQRRTANVLTRTQGNADVVIGAPGFDTGKGKAYVLLGGVDDTEIGSAFPVTELADHIISPADTVTSFGSNLNNVFDINGDNFLDVTIGGSNKLTLSY